MRENRVLLVGTALAIGASQVSEAQALSPLKNSPEGGSSLGLTAPNPVDSSNDKLREFGVTLEGQETDKNPADILVVPPTVLTDEESQRINELIPEENLNKDIALVVEDGQLALNSGSDFEQTVSALNGLKREISGYGGNADLLILVGHLETGETKYAPILNVSQEFESADGTKFEKDTVILINEDQAASYLIPNPEIGNGKAEVIKVTQADVEALTEWFGDDPNFSLPNPGDWILAQRDGEGHLARLAARGLAYEFLTQKVTARDQEANVRATPTTEAPVVGTINNSDGLERVQATPENLELLKARGLNVVEDGLFTKVEGQDGSLWYVVQTTGGEIGLVRDDVAVLGEVKGSGPIIGNAEAPADNVADIDLYEDLSAQIGSNEDILAGYALGVADRNGPAIENREEGISAWNAWGKILNYGPQSYEVQDIFDADRKFLVDAYTLTIQIPSKQRSFIVAFRAMVRADVVDIVTGDRRNVFDYSDTPGIVSLVQKPDESMRGWSAQDGFDSINDYVEGGGKFIGVDLAKSFTPESAARSLEQYSGKSCDQYDLCTFVISDMFVSDSETEFVNDYRTADSDENVPVFYVMPTHTIGVVFPPGSGIDIYRGEDR